MISNKTRGYFTILLLLLVCATTVANAQSEKKRIEGIAFKSTVYIEVSGVTASGEKWGARGSGFLVAPNLIATNYHVIHQATKVTAFYAATGQEIDIEGATAINAYRDLAILKTGSDPPPPGGIAAGGFLFAREKRPLSLGDSDNIRVNDTVYVAGYPGGNRSFGKGRVKGLSGLAGCSESDFEVTFGTGMAPGSSGGPVLNSSGYVTGISVRGIIIFFFPLKAFAVRVNYLRDLINQQSGSVKYHFPIDAQLYECSAISRGNMHFENGDYSEALAYFNSVISSIPGSALAYLNRALLYHKVGNLAQARSDFNQAWNLTRSANFRALLQSVRHLF